MSKYEEYRAIVEKMETVYQADVKGTQEKGHFEEYIQEQLREFKRKCPNGVSGKAAIAAAENAATLTIAAIAILEDINKFIGVSGRL